MAASPAIDLGEPLAALFKRARVADSLYRRYEGWLVELCVGDAGDLLEEVAEKGTGSLNIHDRQAEKLRQALLGEKAFEVSFEARDALRKVEAREAGGEGAVISGPMWKQIQDGTGLS